MFLTFSLFCPLQIIGRVNADPDYLPRAMDFGLNISGFLENYYPPNCPPAFFPIAALCCDLDADKRSEISQKMCTEIRLKNISLPGILFYWESFLPVFTTFSDLSVEVKLISLSKSNRYAIITNWISKNKKGYSFMNSASIHELNICMVIC